MKTRMVEKDKGRSSLATRGRFFLILISIFCCFETLYATVPNEHDDETTEFVDKTDSLKLISKSNSNNTAKIYVTGGAQITDLENTISSPIIIIKENKKDVPPKKEKDRVKSKVKNQKDAKKPSHPKSISPKFYFSNPQDQEFNHFDVGLDKAVVTTNHQLKLFSINKLFILSFVLFVSIYLTCVFKENTFFISVIGKNFQRPPPYFSPELF